jgi:hypothetical protein
MKGGHDGCGQSLAHSQRLAPMICRLETTDQPTLFCLQRQMDGISATIVIPSDDTLVVAGALEALVELIVLAIQLAGVGTRGVELLGLLAFAVRVPFQEPVSASWSGLAKAQTEENRDLRVGPATRIGALRRLDPLGVV